MSDIAREAVCVTGGSGFIASWLVKLLLQQGYIVHATVRDLDDPKKVDHLKALPPANGMLKLFQADLLVEGSFDSVIDGCVGVFHTASPFYLTPTDPQAELIEPAVRGTLNVLKSCAKTPSVKRVVVTSSTAAVTYNGKPLTPEVVVDESWFSNAEILKDSKLSKTLAEEVVWKFVKENELDVITINPAMVIGPLLQPTLNTSAVAIFNLIKGSMNHKTKPQTKTPSASGRYCLVERVAHFSDIVKALHELYPRISLPQKCAGDEPFVPTYQVSIEKAKALGIDFTPLEVSLKETVESLNENGFLNL
ncbi:hypothetical protein Syun_017537 [Stephania yunnanensis]|uniref:NAD-dependent epimerase/dehydratase domain-containing protein n=1 Tax=Stephania yunnanensis TaxID=152371 RepID=A0AAP0P573_9MAGN